MKGCKKKMGKLKPMVCGKTIIMDEIIYCDNCLNKFILQAKDEMY